ncbi:MAG: hypothetical protein QOE41_2545 [Mycobacterium sp.]|jgi:hypothetical protein|nr:hypothetical protein [Mycobacterium sp.]
MFSPAPRLSQGQVHHLNSHSTDCGCTAPAATSPGYLCEVNRVEEWAENGRTEWIQPPHDNGRPRSNTLHHPEKLLPDNKDDERASCRSGSKHIVDRFV